MQGCGSQSWDAGLSIQALLASDLVDEIGDVLAKGHDYLKKAQVTENPSGDYRAMLRHMSKGAWTFSDRDQGWQVSDSTAEAFKAYFFRSFIYTYNSRLDCIRQERFFFPPCLQCCLGLSMLPAEIVGEKMEQERLYDTVNFLINIQVSKQFPSLVHFKNFRI